MVLMSICIDVLFCFSIAIFWSCLICCCNLCFLTYCGFLCILFSSFILHSSLTWIFISSFIALANSRPMTVYLLICNTFLNYCNIWIFSFKQFVHCMIWSHIIFKIDHFEMVAHDTHADFYSPLNLLPGISCCCGSCLIFC